MSTSLEEVERALNNARSTGDQHSADLIERRRLRMLAEMESQPSGPALSAGEPTAEANAHTGIGGPALSRQQRMERISAYDQELASLKPKARSGALTGSDRMDTGEGPSMGVLMQDRPEMMQRDDTMTALEVGTKRTVENYFKRKDEAIETRDALYDHVFNQLPQAEQERMKKPRHFGWQYDSYKNMPPIDFVNAIRKGGQVSDEELAYMVGGQEQFDKLLAGEIGGEAGGIYRHLIQPMLTKDGVIPSEQLAAAVQRAQENYSEDTRESLDKPFVAEDATWNPTTWFDETTKAPWEDWDGFYYSFIENAPQIALSIGAARQGGKAGAGIAAKLAERTKASLLIKAQQRGATAGGVLAGAGTEGALIRDSVYSETSQRVHDLPQEKWEENPEYVQLLGAGYDEELAKQVIGSEIANKAGNTAMVVAGFMMGAPMSAVFGKAAAGRLGGQAAAPAAALGFLGEGLQESSQEGMEQFVGNLNLRRIDPDQPLFEGVGESMAGGFFIGAPAGAVGALPSQKPAGIDRQTQKVLKETNNYTEAANERWKFQNKISKDDPMYEATPRQRVNDLHQLERLQKKEAEALLKAEPVMREHMMKHGAPEAEIQMLDRLKMRANVMLTDIAVAKSKRTTAAQMLEQERLIQKERAEIQRKVDENLFERNEIKSMADAIEGVQNFEAVREEDLERLRKEGYGRYTDGGKFVILPKGSRALKELRRQQEVVQKKLDAGYTGTERRDPSNQTRRDMIASATPEAIEQMLYTDNLTGLGNKRAFEERSGGASAYAVADVDSLAWVNDNMGHAAGDRLLQLVGDAMGKHDGVTSYHISGDEFVVTGDTEQDIEQALQAVAEELKSQKVVAKTDEVTPTITWGKGPSFEAADAQMNETKEQRTREGKRAQRKAPPVTHKDRASTQGLLFHQIPPTNSVDRRKAEPTDSELPNRWSQVRDQVERGDIVEMLTPTGAAYGIVSKVRKRKGKDRLHVSAGGREFVFNPTKNWLIRPEFDADLDWLNDGVEFEPTIKSGPPHVVPDVMIGHLGREDSVYADLGGEYQLPGYFETSMFPDAYSEAYANWNGWDTKVPYVPPTREATPQEMKRAEAVVRNLTTGYRNLPRITLVGSIAELKSIAPHMLEKMIAQGASENGTRGFFDEEEPQNGIVLLVQNIASYTNTLERDIAETLLHELIGHYGIRGLFGHEAQMRHFMHQVVDEFPVLAKRFASRLRLNPAVDSDKQLLGEEMIAYVTGEMLSKQIDFTPKQQTLVQKIFAWIKDFLTRHGWGKYFQRRTEKKAAKSLTPSERELWSDEDIQNLLSRAQDFVRNGKGFQFTYLTGQKVRLMRDGEIFQSGLLTALISGTRTLSKQERKQLQAQGKEVVREVPLFPEDSSPANYLNIVRNISKPDVKMVSAKELETSNIEEFLTESTYQTLVQFTGSPLTAAGEYSHEAFESIMPPEMAERYKEARTILQDFLAMPVEQDTTLTPQQNDKIRAARNTIDELQEQKIDPKKTRMTKDILSNYLNSERVVKVVAMPAVSRRRSMHDIDIGNRLFGADNWNPMEQTEEQQKAIAEEQERILRHGPNIGYHEVLQQWQDYQEESQYSRYAPQGILKNVDYREYFLKQEGGGYRVGRTQHHGEQEGVLVHLRYGLGEVAPNLEGFPELPEAPNPSMKGHVLALGEMQTDWLQALRKQWSSESERTKANKIAKASQERLKSIVMDMGQNITASLTSAAERLLEPFVEAVTFETPSDLAEEGSQQPLSKEYRAFIEKRQAETGETYDALTGMTLFVQEKLIPASNAFGEALSALVEYRRKKNDGYVAALDARAFAELDQMAVHEMSHGIDNALAKLRDELRNVAYSYDPENPITRESIQESIAASFNRFMARLRDGAGYNSSPIYRLPVAAAEIKNMLSLVYEKLGAGLPDVDVDNAVTNRVEHMVHIPRSALEIPEGIDLSLGSPLALFTEIFSNHRLSTIGVDMTRVNVVVEEGERLSKKDQGKKAPEKIITVRAEGSKPAVDEFVSKVDGYLRDFMKEHMANLYQQKIAEQEMKDAAERGTESPNALDPNDVPFSDIESEYQMEEIETEEPSTATREWDVETYAAFEEARYDNAFQTELQWRLENIDWDEVNDDDHGEPLNRRNPGYRERVEFDDDGDADTTDAEEWLQEQRDEHEAWIRDEDEGLRESVTDDLRNQWDEEGGTVLFVGRLPTRWDEDGDATEDVSIVYRRSSVGGDYELLINGDEVHSSSDDFRDQIAEDIREYYEGEEIVPPPGKLFAPEEAAPINEVVLPSPDQLDLLREAPPDFNALAERVASSVTNTINPKPESPLQTFETLVRISKKSSYVGVPSPLADDKYWRTIALRYLLADAVRRGIPGIVWNPGMATTTRGSAGFHGVRADTLNWRVEKMMLRGKEHELLVLSSPDMQETIAVDPKRATPVLGRDVVEYIEAQRKGEKPKYTPRKTGKGGKPLASAADYLISESAGVGSVPGVVVVQSRNTHDLIGIFKNREEANARISELVNNANEEASAEQELSHTRLAGGFIEEEGVESGRVTTDDMGGQIAIITGDIITDYSHTLDTPILAGARMNYEEITVSYWNKELKQYGVQISETAVRATDIETATYKEGARRIPGTTRDNKIRETYGDVTIDEMTGGSHGWLLMSSKKGVLDNRVYVLRSQAESALEDFLTEKFGKPDGFIKTFFIPITDEIIADYKGKPKAPFHFDPRKDPVLRAAADKIGQDDKPSFRERYREWRQAWKDEFHAGMFDRFYGLKRALRRSGQEFSAETDPYIQTRLTTSLDSVMRAAMEYGHPVWKEGIVQVEGKGLVEILQPVINDIDSWSMYMAGVRAKRLLTGGDESRWQEMFDPQVAAGRKAQIIEQGREKLFTPEEIKAMIAIGDNHPVFKRVADEYAAYNKKVLDFAEEAGVINADTRPMWENADYVPFYRVQDDRLVGPLSKSSGIANQKSPIKRLKGGEGKVGDIAHNIMINLTKLIDTSMKNHAALLAVDSLLESGIVQRKPMTGSQEMIPLQQVKKLLIDRGMNPDAIPQDALDGFQKMFAIQPPEGPGVISILRNGKKEFYYTDDELLYRAMSAINRKQWGAWMNLMRAPKRLLTSWVTLDPGFMIANYIRDSLSAFVLGRDHFVPVAGALKGFAKALTKDKDMQLLLSSGSAFESGYINQYDPNATKRLLKKAMRKKSFRQTLLTSPMKLYEAWKAIGSATENANRMAVYQAAIRAGKGKAQAAYEAKDLMDFSMSGDWPVIQFLVQTVPFLGARMQGIHRLGRGAHEHPMAFTMKGTLVGLAGLALWFAFKDDERYKELEDWDKDVYFHFWIGDNHYRLPKPFEVGAIFNTIPERIFEYIYSQENDKGKHLLNRFGFMLAETFNANPVPQAVRPLAESYFNYNWFAGRDIVSPYEEERLPPEQYRYTTSPTMVELARMLPAEMDAVSGKIRSPLHLQSLYAGYTGTIGRYFLMASDAMLRETMQMADPPQRPVADYPVVGRFVRGDQPRRTKYEQEVYDLIRKTAQVQGSVNYLAKTDQLDRMDEVIAREEPYVLVAGSLEDVRRSVGKINEAIMKVWLDKDMTPEQKRTEIDILQEDKNALFKEGFELRPGGRLNPGGPVTKQNIQDLIEKFGVDPIATDQLQDAGPSTYDLLNQVAELNRKQLEALARLAPE